MFGAARLALYSANPSGAANTGFGYWMGGYTTGRVATIRKYTFPTDTVGAAGTSLSAARDQVCGISDTVIGHGFGGGTGGNGLTDHEKWTISTEAKTSGTVLPSGRRDMHSGVSTATYGYLLGGYNSTFVNTIQKYQHSNDSYPTFTNTLWSGTVWTSCAAHNNTTLAIAVGGYNGSTTNTNYARFTFSSETAATAQSLPAAQGQVSMCGDQSRAFMFTGFTNPFVTMTNAVKNYTFSTDTWASSTNLGYTQRYGDGAGNDAVGVIGGGTAGTFTLATAHTKITYATDTFATASQLFAVATDTPGAWSSSQIQ